MTEEKAKCDIDDIVCQMQVLAHLKGMQSILGEERYKGDFPEFEGLDEKLAGRIESQETSLQEALDKCGLPQLETPIVEVPILDEIRGEEEE